jgi:hypothetical protein
MSKQLTTAELTAGLTNVVAAPADGGVVQLVVARPFDDERQVLTEGAFTVADGLAGDNWRMRGSKRTADGSAHPEMQIAVMNGRFLNLVADNQQELWPLAGDQLIVDLDLSAANLQAGDRLAMGTAVFEVTPVPHNGCAKFSRRYGVDAVTFANSPEGKALRLRGLYVKVVQDGLVRPGDTIRKIPGQP